MTTYEETRVCSACGERHVHRITVKYDGRVKTTSTTCTGCWVGYSNQRLAQPWERRPETPTVRYI